MNVAFKIIIFCTLYAILNVFGATLIKKELINKNLNKISDYLNLLQEFKVIGAFIVIFLSALVMFKTLSLGKFSIIIPMATGINFLITIGVGVLVFKDKIGIVQLIGIILIIAGIIAVSYSQK